MQLILCLGLLEDLIGTSAKRMVSYSHDLYLPSQRSSYLFLSILFALGFGVLAGTYSRHLHFKKKEKRAELFKQLQLAEQIRQLREDKVQDHSRCNVKMILF